MTTSNRSEGVLSTIFMTVCVGFSVLGLVIQVARLVSPRTPDRAAQARAYENYQNWQKANNLMKDPFGRSAFGPSYTISPQTKEDMARSRTAIEAFMNEVRADNLSAAYRLTSASFRERTGQEDFELLICNHPDLKQQARCTVIGTVNYPDRSVSQMFNSPASATLTINFTSTSAGNRLEIDDLQITEKK